MNPQRLAAITALLSLLALPVFGATLRIVPYADGKMATDTEACFWRGRNFDDFFDRFLASGEVRCYPITNVPQLPDGVWSYYVQSSTRISSHPDGIELIGPGSVRPISVELLPAGTLDLRAAISALRPDEYFALYVSNEHRETSQPAVRPIPKGAPEVLIPADMHVLLLVISGEQIVWASRPFLVHEGGRLRAPLPDRATHDVILLIGIDRSVYSAERDAVKGSKPPDVSLAGHDRTLHPAFELRTAPVFDTSIVEFIDVPNGEYTAHVGGAYWLPDNAGVTVPAAGNSIAQPARPMVTRPRGRIEIRWHATRALATALPPTCSTAPSSSAPTTPPHLTLRHCIFGFGAPADCVTVHDEEVREESGESAIEQLAPGDYYVTLGDKKTSTRERCSVQPAHTTSVAITLAPGHISGRVTRAGAPLAAVVSFASGATRADERGDYDVFVAEPPGDRPVVVTPCDTGREFIDVPRQPLLLDDTYDVEVPDNQLTIGVVDAVTRAPLPNTSVTSRIITPEHTISSRMLGRTNAAGVITDAVLSEHVTLELCARHEGYEAACLRNVRMRQARENVTITLQHARGRAVHIVADPPVGPGRVYVVVGSTVIEEALIEPDQTISLDHFTPAATLYLVAINYPLLRLSLPDLTQSDPILRVPAGHPVTRTVTLSPDTPHRGGPIGLAIDGIPLPDAILMHAQALHDTSEPYVHPGETITIGPLDETMAATVLLWHDNADLPLDLRVPDPFTNPHTAGLVYRAPLAGEHVMLKPAR